MRDGRRTVTREEHARHLASVVADAIASGRHPMMDVLNNVGLQLHVCSGCREFKPIWMEVGTGGGVGVAGRVELCRECCELRGLK